MENFNFDDDEQNNTQAENNNTPIEQKVVNPAKETKLMPTDRNEQVATEDDQRNQALCLNLATAETRSEVIKHLQDAGYWDDESCWRDYGDNENNWSKVGNQQATLDAALVEKLTNSIDAMLLNACRERGDDPESDNVPNVPKNMREAAEQYFNVKEGNLSDLTSSELSDLARKIKFVATGATTKTTKNPEINYIIADEGEGQTPDNMPNTLLSLESSNKNKIPFVHGSFNMGSTGVFRFDDNLLQLILTRRNPKIADKAEADWNSWGFTIVRLFPPIGNMKNFVLRYLAPQHEILRFRAESLPILPRKHPEAYGDPMHFGTFIKLYGYESRRKVSITLELQKRLALLLSKPCLPIRLYERRSSIGKSGYPESNMAGLQTRLDHDRGDNIEKGFPYRIPFSLLSEKKVKGSIYVFKKDIAKEIYTKRTEGIVFLLNGQCQGKESRVWFKKECGLDYISDSMLVFIDCSEISPLNKNKMFMTSRDRISEDFDLTKEIFSELSDFLKNHDGLKELNMQRRAEQVSEKTGDEKALRDTLQKVINQSPSLQSLLGNGNRLSNAFGKNEGKPEVLLNKFPSFFKLERDFEKSKPKQLPSNREKARIKFKTDAENDYFERSNDAGTFELLVNGEKYPDFSINLWNGRATLQIKLSEAWQEGDSLKIETSVSDITRIEPFVDSFYMQISVAQEKPDSPNSPKPKEGGLAMPEVIEVSKKDWGDHSFDRESALKVMSNKESGEHDFFVNIDNVNLLHEIKSHPKVPPEALREQYKIGMALFGLALLSEPEKETQDENQDDEGDVVEDEITDEKIGRLSKLFSIILLPIIALASLSDD